jgi:tetratricopeptide (TPR) repeat protein
VSGGTFTHPRRILAAWLALLLAGAALLGLGYAWLARHEARLREGSPWTHLKEAERLKNANRPQAAIAALQRAAELDPASPVPHEEMGRIYYTRQSDWTKAIESYRQALVLGSESIEARGKILWSLIHLGRYQDAAEFGIGCVQQGYEDPEFDRYIAEAYRRAGMHAESIPYFEAAVEAFPGDTLLLERLIQAYTAIGDAEKAAETDRRLQRSEG